jgi:SpoU rRNA Methylase family
VLGHEVTGVDVNILALCDGVVEIPVYGVKNSLNVCSAATAAVFEALRQWKLIEGSAAAAAAGTRSRKRVRVGDSGLKSSADGNSSSDEVCYSLINTSTMLTILCHASLCRLLL